MSQSLNSAIAVIGIDIGKNSFHVVGLDDRGAIVLRQKWSRGQIEVRLACASDWSASALASSIRFAPSCWSAVCPSGRGYGSCELSCRAS